VRAQVDVVGNEGAATLACDQHAFLVQVVKGPFHRNHTHARGRSQGPDRWNFGAGRPVTHRNAMPDLLHDLEVHWPAVGLGDVELTVHIVIYTIYTVYSRWQLFFLELWYTGEKEGGTLQAILAS